MDAHQPISIDGGAGQGLFVQAAQPVEHPEPVRLLERIGSGLEELSQWFNDGLANFVIQRIHRQHPARDVRVAQFRDQPIHSRGKRKTRLRNSACSSGVSAIDNPPDPPPFAVAARMVEPHLVMADDAIIEVRHIKRSIRPKLQIDRTEPRILAAQEIRLFPRDARGTMHRKGVPVDPASHHVADESVAMIDRREVLSGVINHPRDGRRAVAVAANIRPETQAIVRFAETRIIAPAQQDIDRRAVAIG